MTTAATQLAEFFAKYEPAIARLGKALRAKLRARLPGLTEVVYWYERQQSLVIAYSPTEQGYAAVCTLSLYPEQVKLFFAGGPQLAKADPGKLLQGSGKLVRFVPMAKDSRRRQTVSERSASKEIAWWGPTVNARFTQREANWRLSGALDQHANS